MTIGGTWETVDGKRLVLRTASGVVDVKGIDVWSAEYEGLNEIAGSECNRPSSDLPHLELSADLLELQPVLLSTASGRTCVALRVINAAGQPILDYWPTADQIIIGNQWFATGQDHTERTAKALRSHGIELLLELSEAQEMWLLWHSDLGVDYFEGEHPGVVVQPRADEVRSTPGQLVDAALYPYQATGIAKLTSMAAQDLGCLLADEMGLGKTIQAIGLMSWMTKNSGSPSLVVAPSSTTANWCRELSRFAPHLSTYEHTGSKRTGDPSVLMGFDVVVTSFDLMIRDEFLLRAIKWMSVSVDEAQNVKNPLAQRSQILKRLDSRTIIAITGTPIENSLTDLWSIMALVAPDHLSSLDDFKRHYPDEAHAALELGRRVAPLIIRRRVTDVAGDLPTRTDSVVPIHVSNLLALEYERIRLDGSIPPLAKVGYLRQICSTLRCLDGSFPPITTGNPKYEQALQIISEAFSRDCKVLLFASYTSTIDEIQSDLQNRFPSAFVSRLDGQVPIRARQPTIDEFTRYAGPAILVLNPKAAGVGINIQAANYVIHFTPEWNPATIDQASARSYRRGQGKPVFVYSLYYKDTIEELMLERVHAKRVLSAHGLKGAEELPSNLELEEMIMRSPKESAI
ncbi:DEAD/DEAH box helicase [Pseudarthrobacter sp. CCNWLW207]|uniref:DEAD/DEAH box helicase n=1 Tax=Pseudarthrobacter sp. CCNWLW207 TaxID=3127468 RepID=UPI0030773730